MKLYILTMLSLSLLSSLGSFSWLSVDNLQLHDDFFEYPDGISQISQLWYLFLLPTLNLVILATAQIFSLMKRKIKMNPYFIQNYAQLSPLQSGFSWLFSVQLLCFIFFISLITIWHFIIMFVYCSHPSNIKTSLGQGLCYSLLYSQCSEKSLAHSSP